MKTTNEKLEQWAVAKIQKDFQDDVCLLLDHKTLYLDKDNKAGKTGFGTFIPATTRANGLAKTFIIDGIGYDLFPQSWERYERMADIDHYNLTCLDDSTIVWARTDADRQRFESLQARFRANLKNPNLMLQRAKKWLGSATELFAEMFFDEKLHIVKQKAGHICALLSIAIAYINGTFFRHGQTAQIDELCKMQNVPENFIEIYKSVVFEKTIDTQKKLCSRLLGITRDHLKAFENVRKSSAGELEELIDWYHELSYTWRRAGHFCEANDPVSAFIWACMLQSELGAITNDCQLPEHDILGSYDPKNLAAFHSKLKESESAIVKAIETAGGRLENYSTIDDFLNAMIS